MSVNLCPPHHIERFVNDFQLDDRTFWHPGLTTVMNWNPLKRLSLLNQQKLKLDPVTQIASEQLEKLLVEFDAAENIIKSLHQSVKKLLDEILCVGKFETKSVEELSNSTIFTNSERMRTIIDEWNSLASVSSTVGDEYAISLQKTVIEPLKQVKQAFIELKAQIRLHDSIQLDVIRFQRKVANYNERERTGNNLVKLQENKQLLASRQREFANRTHLLLKDLGKFLNGSVEMLQPLLESFIAAEIAWVHASKRSMDSRSHIISAIEAQTQSDRLRKIELSFRSLSELSICYESK